MLKIVELNKSYNDFKALNNINLNLENGVFGLLGPNGAGKTTLMKCIATLLTDFSGKISFENIHWEKNNEKNVKSLIGYLPQHFNIYGNLKVYEALEHIQILKRGKIDNNELDVIIEKVNLQDHKNKKIKELSGGMLRRVGIAQAIIGNPKILIIDEPTAGLDPMERSRFRSLLYSLSKNNIVIISTHIVEDLEAIANTIAFIKSGKIVCHDTVNNILQDLENEVHEREVDNVELNSIMDKNNVISVKKSGKFNVIRFLDKSINGNTVKPTIEDAYYKYLGAD